MSAQGCPAHRGAFCRGQEPEPPFPECRTLQNIGQLEVDRKIIALEILRAVNTGERNANPKQDRAWRCPAVRRARQSSLSEALLSRPCEEAKPLEHDAGLESKARKRVGQCGNFNHVEHVVYENMVVDFGDIARLAVATVALWPRRSVSQVAKVES